MSSVTVRAGAHSYEVIIGPGAVDQAGALLQKIVRGPGCALISDAQVAPLFAERVMNSLSAGGFQPTLITVPAGEKSKCLEQVNAVCDQMIEAGLDRHSFVVGLGGGVIGDLSGFVAAIYHRGIPHAQIPSTLLAMVDSSIGGKTGVNARSGKNLIGAVHQPVVVMDDLNILGTLPPRELKQGFAEIIKHGVIADAGIFDRLREFDPTQIGSLIQRNVEIKAAVVARDEHDRTGERAILNFGHTVGHAIEAAGGYRDLMHGEAISLGMVAACAISRDRAGFAAADEKTVVDTLGKFDLPTKLPPNFPKGKILEALPRDKKFESGQVRFVVTPALGTARLADNVTMDDIRAAVASL